ncbi:MAG: PEGA domain-containing protein [Bdellovibrionales bacterium]|nr:PEGA domain-containing protein [Bdellovibrionales bacterium]
MAALFFLETTVGVFVPIANAQTSLPDKKLPFLAVVGFRTSDTPSESFYRSELSAELEKSGKVRLTANMVTEQIVNDVWAEGQTTSKKIIREASTQFSEGKKFYSQLLMEDAITSFNKAVIGYREGIGALRDNRYLLISHLYLGMALMVLGRKKEGENFIREMIVLDSNRSNRRLSKTEFPPDVIKVHKTLTKQVLDSPMGMVVVSFKPLNANVYIDAVIQDGKEKITRNLPVGEHFVVVEKKGYRQFSKRILVKPGINTVDVELDQWELLSPYSEKRQSNLLEKESLLKLGSDLSANILLLGAVTQTSPGRSVISTQLFDIKTKRFSKIEAMEVANSNVQSSGKKMAKKILAHLSSTGKVIAGVGQRAVTIDKEISREDTPIIRERDRAPLMLHKKWWFWTALGVVAVGAGAFLVLNKKDPGYNLLTIDNPL